MPIDFSLGKPFCLLFLELHRYELHYPVNYYKCFISLQSIDNLPLVLILVFCSQDMPSPFKDLSGSIFRFIQIAPFTSSRTHFSFSRSSHFTLWLWLHTFWKSVSPASLSDPTVIGTFAIVLFAVITECRLQIQLALLKPLPNFFTPILSAPTRSNSSIILRKSLKPSAPSAVVLS